MGATMTIDKKNCLAITSLRRRQEGVWRRLTKGGGGGGNLARDDQICEHYAVTNHFVDTFVSRKPAGRPTMLLVALPIAA